jgi:hypothetical protein
MDDLVELVETYWEYYRRSTSDDRAVQRSANEAWWAWGEIEERVRSKPADAIELLTTAADAAPGDGALAYLGAGPVENLLRGCQSVEVIDRIDGAARRNENFRKALRYAWFDDHVSPTVAERLRRFGSPY